MRNLLNREPSEISDPVWWLWWTLWDRWEAQNGKHSMPPSAPTPEMDRLERIFVVEPRFRAQDVKLFREHLKRENERV